MKRQKCRKAASILPVFHLKAVYKFYSYWRQTLISPEMAPEESTSKAHSLSIISSCMFTLPCLIPWEGFPLSCHPPTRWLLFVEDALWARVPSHHREWLFMRVSSAARVIYRLFLFVTLSSFPCRLCGGWLGRIKASCVVSVCSLLSLITWGDTCMRQATWVCLWVARRVKAGLFLTNFD